MNIFEALRHDHDKQRELVDALIQTHGDTQQRHKLMDELKTELEDHAKFEERYFYNPLMFDDLTHEKARHSVAEHHEIDELIEQLEDTEMSSSAWLVTAKKLHHLVHHHLSEEEHEVFQLAGKALTEGQKESLAKQYNDAMH
ncbi:hemerythrin domain-containing protein [Pseudoalteromonas sp. CST5]|uniref:hemerythrin domain-containing protein n=1 Tax=unclassified Pseudoalteromonas TaxID=194690 RepID=UPI002359B6A4|nr:MULTISPECIES: hemerythrin domain-containing protein [unclassified Pseudoalteromonas]MDC9514132.1 hemerythrin domain-containing protein [Pseudoalteromonas sp. CST1]MDC9538554.1 hemerythrin domain-containing protein [Pseudoalteromonas sp. CST3]MDC9542665.1 hemerythrin domain-containing protein [Pseudoalteromonas sp. CST2]MDC9545237.1 hemerythrin domain-containing protein [Pseudoalteromonas sp. CST4]MDC9550204.1 hemerythrin domain-containing protein [Pseudoalteromonas sp. CST5]